MIYRTDRSRKHRFCSPHLITVTKNDNLNSRSCKERKNALEKCEARTVQNFCPLQFLWTAKAKKDVLLWMCIKQGCFHHFCNADTAFYASQIFRIQQTQSSNCDGQNMANPQYLHSSTDGVNNSNSWWALTASN